MDLAAALLSLALRLADLQRPRISESVTVTSAAPSISTPSAVTVLGSEAIAVTPSLTLDDALRSVPGFSLFRRSSSRVANPTTQGVTLRGLAASGSSRALVLADDVPLNDPVGGWVYWNRVPAVALREVAVARGASGDVYGADALAGVVELRTDRSSGARLLADGGSGGTGQVSGYAGGRRGGLSLFGAAEGFTTDGFVTTAPEARGPVDIPASSRYASEYGAVDLPVADGRLALRGSHFGESRGNGTPLQRNSTRVSLVSANLTNPRGWSARGYAQAQRYEQTFSAVDDARLSERQTSAQDVSATVAGGAADWGWSHAAYSGLVSITARHVDADLEDVAFNLAGVPQVPTVTTPAQTIVSTGAQGSRNRGRAGFGAGARVEWWRSAFDEVNSRVFVSPRVWATYAATAAVTLRAAYQSGHRGPTSNELYRPFRVGNVVTQANPDLGPETARGLEAGASWRTRRLAVRALGFWSRVDDAIVNVTLSSGSVIQRQRQNAARIRATGAELEVEMRVAPGTALTGSTAFTDSQFVAGPLEGLRVPQVPRWHHAIGGRGTFGALRVSGEWRFVGQQFDDDRNAFPLDESSSFDARAGWMLQRGVELFAAMENVFDEEQDVGRTPFRTIGLPRTTRAGVRVVF